MIVTIPERNGAFTVLSAWKDKNRKRKEKHMPNGKNQAATFLVIAEKPSVSQALAKALEAGNKEDGYFSGENCMVSWCLGHLAEYVQPEAYDERYQKWKFEDLPIIPDEWRLTVAKDKKAQFQVLKKLLNRNDLAYVVNACDAGREGELIFRFVYELSGSKIPVKRLWISSLEDGAIREGIASLREGSAYDGILQAAVCRAKADWLIGINATRAFTTKYDKRLTVGRVQTPTLAMLVERQDQISAFTKETYYKAELEGKGIVVVSGNIREEAECDNLIEQCQGKTAVISKVEKIQKKNKPPNLYDLTTLQREANRIFGYTARETLNELQELYEARLVTYPRTDSQFITEDMEHTVLKLLEQLPAMLPFLPVDSIGRETGRIMDNRKVSDHHALLPTEESAKKDLKDLSEKQRNIFYLIGQRLAQAVSEECIYEEIVITVSCEGHEFRAKGKSIIQPGFKEIGDSFHEAIEKGGTVDNEEAADKTEADQEYRAFGELREGMEIPEITARKSRHFTSPPKPYNEDTLLAAMEMAGKQDFDKETEKKGLGTPATRASIIEKIVSSGYAERKGKQILPTVEGRELISVLPEYLKSAAMTAEWENCLLLIERGQLCEKDFLRGILEFITGMIDGCGKISQEEQNRFHQKENIGHCPVCGTAIRESKKSFYCPNKECLFVLWKENRYLANMNKKMDRKMAVDLLKNGRTHVKDLYSQKKGTTFAADLVMSIKDGRSSFELEFPKKKAGKSNGK